MSKFCRTFAREIAKVMKKMQYIQPKSMVEGIQEGMYIMIKDSGSGLEPAPARPNMGAIEE